MASLVRQIATGSASSAKRPSTCDEDEDAAERPSKRTAWSCLECTRRKIRCDKVIPCMPCSRRGQAESCRRAPSAADSSNEPPARRKASPAELDSLRLAFNGMQQRLFHLERVLASFYATSIASDGTPDELVLPPPAVMAALPGFTEPVRQLADAGPPLSSSPPEDIALPKYAVLDLDDEPEAQLDAVLALERFALGWEQKRDYSERSRVQRAVGSNGGGIASSNLDPLSPRSSAASAVDTASSAHSPLQAASSDLVARLPPRSLRNRIIEYSLSEVAWQHGGVVHDSVFGRERAEFEAWTPAQQAQNVNPAWLSLYFALLAAGVRQMNGAVAQTIGLSQDGLNNYPSAFFEAAVDALHLAKWQEVHTFYSLQTVAIFCLVVQDVAPLPLISSMLGSAIRIAQLMGLHRLGPDAEWIEAQRKKGVDFTTASGADSLIARELSKRVWYGFVAEDHSWFSTTFSCAINLAHCTTPPPLNLHNDDLAAGRVDARSIEEPTVATKAIVYARLAAALRTPFESAVADKVHASEALLSCVQFDSATQALAAQVPVFLSREADISQLPPFVLALRRWYNMLMSHKHLLVSRFALSRRFNDPYLNAVRLAAIAAARRTLTLLDCPATSSVQHVWTTTYHAFAAAAYLTFELYQRDFDAGSTAPPVSHDEIQSAIDSMRHLEVPGCRFLPRGIAVLDALLVELDKHAAREGEPSASHAQPLPTDPLFPGFSDFSALASTGLHSSAPFQLPLQANPPGFGTGGAADASEFWSLGNLHELGQHWWTGS